MKSVTDEDTAFWRSVPGIVGDIAIGTTEPTVSLENYLADRPTREGDVVQWSCDTEPNET